MTCGLCLPWLRHCSDETIKSFGVVNQSHGLCHRHVSLAVFSESISTYSRTLEASERKTGPTHPLTIGHEAELLERECLARPIESPVLSLFGARQRQAIGGWVTGLDTVAKR